MRELVVYPNPILLKPSRPLTDDEIKDNRFDPGVTDFERDANALTDLLDDMGRIMRSSDGAGLAAPQVGVNIRVALIELPGRKAGPLALINPEIVERNGFQEGKEGCLSLPNIGVNVKRAERIKIVTRTLDGRSVDFEAQGALSKAIQHEMDHLDGILIIKRGNIIGNRRTAEQLEKLEQQYERWNKRTAKPV